jgi:hypothetical protein
MDVLLGLAVVCAFGAVVVGCAWVGKKTSTDMFAIMIGLILIAFGAFEMLGETTDHGHLWHIPVGLGLVGFGILERPPRRSTRLLALAGLVIAATDLAIHPSHGQAVVAFFLTACVVAGIANDETWAVRAGVFFAMVGVLWTMESGRRDQPWWSIGFGLALAGLGLAARNPHRRSLVKSLATVLAAVCAVLVLVDLASGWWLAHDVLPKPLRDQLMLELIVAWELRGLSDAPGPNLAAASEASTMA